MRFDLKFTLLLMSSFCVLAWASMANHPLAWVSVVTIIQLTVALYAARQGTSPYTWAAIGGVISLFALAICLGPLQTIAYLMFGAAPDKYQDYFEDGVAFAVITPFFSAVFYAPICIMTGLLIGLVVRCSQRFRLQSVRPAD